MYNLTESGNFSKQSEIMNWLLFGGIVMKPRAEGQDGKLYFMDEGTIYEMIIFRDSGRVDKNSKKTTKDAFVYAGDYKPYIEGEQYKDVHFSYRHDRDYPKRVIVEIHLGELNDHQLKCLKELQVIGGSVSLWR